MKNIFLILIFLSNISNAQTYNPVGYTSHKGIKNTGAVESNTHTQLTTRDAVTGQYGWITKANLIGEVLASLPPFSSTLQDVLNNGNSATLMNGNNSVYSFFDPNEVNLTVSSLDFPVSGETVNRSLLLSNNGYTGGLTYTRESGVFPSVVTEKYSFLNVREEGVSLRTNPLNAFFANLRTDSLTSDVTFQFPNQSGTIALTQDFIPITGTQVNNPVTGNIELQNIQNFRLFQGDLLGNHKAVRFNDDNTFDIFNSYNGETGQYSFGSQGLEISSDYNLSRGIVGVQDFSPNITSLDYTQKIYVDNSINNAVKEITSTSLLTLSGLIAINTDNTKFDVPAGTGVIYKNGNIINVSWNAFTAETTPFIGVAPNTFIAIDENGALVKTQDLQDVTQMGDVIPLGFLEHTGSVIERVGTEPQYNVNLGTQWQQFLETFGNFVVEGFDIAGNNLNLNVSVGTMFDNGLGYSQNINAPNHYTANAISVANIRYYYRNGSGGWINNTAFTNNVNPDIYDDGTGSLANIPAGKFTIQRVTYYPPFGYLDVYYDQKYYNSKEEALSGYLSDSFEENPYLSYNLPIAIIVVKHGTTNLNNTADAIIRKVSKSALGGSANLGYGESNTASNIGTTGVGVFKQKTGVNLEFKKLNSSSGKIIVTDDTPNNIIDLDIDEGSLSNINQIAVTGLVSDLANKVSSNTAITGATKTKITYDSKGLVTAGADATTSDIADSTDKRYVTDAQLTVIGNTSGTNTGDNAVNTNYVSDYRASNFVAGINYALPNANTTGTASNITASSNTTLTSLPNLVVSQSQVTNLTTDLATNSTNDRNRANHTGTQTASTISDFNTAVSSTALLKANNLSDVANTTTARNNILPSKTGNANKVLRVNAGETDYELVTLAGGGDALTTNPLSQFASTTSAQLAGVISNETGTGLLVYGTAPTIESPIIPVVTTPATPSANNIVVYGKTEGADDGLYFKNSTGIETEFQDDVTDGQKRIWIGNTSATPATYGAPALTATGTATAVAVALTNAHTKLQGSEYLVTTASTTAVAGFREPAGTWWMGNTANDGGFKLKMVVAPATGVATTTHRFFAGMSTSTTAPTDVNPSTLLNMFGIGYDSADANLQLMSNDGTGTATKTDLGANFVVPTADRTALYELKMSCPPNSTTITYRVMNLSNGATATGTLTTDIPTVNTLLSVRGYTSVGGTSSVTGIAMKKIKVERFN